MLRHKPRHNDPACETAGKKNATVTIELIKSSTSTTFSESVATYAKAVVAIAVSPGGRAVAAARKAARAEKKVKKAGGGHVAGGGDDGSDDDEND